VIHLKVIGLKKAYGKLPYTASDLWQFASIPDMALCQYACLMDKKNFPSTEADKFIVRLPAGMRARIAESAKSNNRSMNAEVVGLLQQAMEARTQTPAPGINTHALAAEIADLVAARLKG